MHAVGTVPGLYLRVLPPPSASKTWILRIKVGSRRRDMGLGGYPAVTVAQAHEAARSKRQLAGEGIDPVGHRRSVLRARRAADMKRMTFAEAADRYIAMHELAWRNAKH